MNTEDTEKIKLPKVLRATIAIFLGITFGVHYPISSETKESTYKDMVVVPGLPFLTYYISTLALASFEKDNAFRFDQLEWAGIWEKIGFGICALILWGSMVGIIYNMIGLFIGLPFTLWNKFSDWRRFR
jgi:hypothetical protein